MNDDFLRTKIKLLKAFDLIDSYLDVACMLEMSPKGFYNWLRGDYNLGTKKKKMLYELITDLWIDDIDTTNLYS